MVASVLNPRHEHFCRLVAAGYSARSAYTSGPRLLKVPAVNARVTELRQTVSTGAIVRAELDREFVLRELVDNALKAKQQGHWAASNRALELLGRELGLFSDDRADVVLPWNGDLDLLTDQQRDALVDLLLGMAVDHDPEKVVTPSIRIKPKENASKRIGTFGESSLPLFLLLYLFFERLQLLGQLSGLFSKTMQTLRQLGWDRRSCLGSWSRRSTARQLGQSIIESIAVNQLVSDCQHDLLQLWHAGFRGLNVYGFDVEEAGPHRQSDDVSAQNMRALLVP